MCEAQVATQDNRSEDSCPLLRFDGNEREGTWPDFRTTIYTITAIAKHKCPIVVASVDHRLSPVHDYSVKEGTLATF